MRQRTLSATEVHQIYDRYGPALVACVYSFLSDYSLAEDIVHNVFLRALRGDLALPESPVAYFFRAVKNAALNTTRDRSRESSLSAQDEWLVHKEGDQVAALGLQRALEQLPEEQREVVVLKHWAGLTFEEVAEATGVPANTAASRYRYGMKKLRELMRGPKTSVERKESNDAPPR